MPQGPSLTRDLPPPPQIVDWASQPNKFGNLGKQPAKPVEPISANDLMSPETQSLMRDDPWQRVGNLADAAWEKLTGKPSYSTLDAGASAKPRYSTVDQQIGMMPVGPEGFFSHAENVLNDTKQGLFTGDQLKGYLKAKGVKDEELKWSGLGELANQPKVTKQQALDTLAKAPRVSEVKLGSNIVEIRAAEQKAFEVTQAHAAFDTKAAQHFGADQSAWPQELQQQWNESYETANQALAHVNELGDQRSASYDRPDLKLPGPSSNYQEILLKHEQAQGEKLDGYLTWYQKAHGVSLEEAKRRVAENPEHYTQFINVPAPKFVGSHYDENDILAHLRLNERPTVDGGLASHSDEYQSDWGNAARKNGVKGTSTDLDHPSSITGVEPAPYIEGSWPELAAKRHLLKAARNSNVTAVTWTTGQQQAERYSLDKHFSRIELGSPRGTIIGNDPNPTMIRAWQKGSSIPIIERRLDDDNKLEDFIGTELANRLRTQTPVYDYHDLSVGEYHLAADGKTRYVINEHQVSGGSRMRQDLMFKNRQDAEDAMQRLRSTTTPATRTLIAPDMKVEDQGKRQFYDRIMPQTMKKLTKQDPRLIDIQSDLEHFEEHGQYGGVTVSGSRPSKQKVWSIPMTNELRSSILKKGFPLYSIVPPALMIGASRLPPPPPDAQE